MLHKRIRYADLIRISTAWLICSTFPGVAAAEIKNIGDVLEVSVPPGWIAIDLDVNTVFVYRQVEGCLVTVEPNAAADLGEALHMQELKRLVREAFSGLAKKNPRKELSAQEHMIDQRPAYRLTFEKLDGQQQVSLTGLFNLGQFILIQCRTDVPSEVSLDDVHAAILDSVHLLHLPRLQTLDLGAGTDPISKWIQATSDRLNNATSSKANALAVILVYDAALLDLAGFTIGCSFVDLSTGQELSVPLGTVGANVEFPEVPPGSYRVQLSASKDDQSYEVLIPEVVILSNVRNTILVKTVKRRL